MTKEEQQFNQWFDWYADGVKVFEEADMKQAYLQGRAELEKENAELKAQLESERDLPAIAYMQGAEKQKKKDEEELKKLKDEWQEQVQKATDEGYARTLQTIQLSKAKELLKNLLSAYTSYADSFDDRDNEIVAEAEQFLNSEVKNDRKQKTS